MDAHRLLAGWGRRGALWVAALLLVVSAAAPVTAADSAGPPVKPLTSPPSYPNSPYHGQIDGDGRVIPCRCRFNGAELKLGTVVCMETHVGTVLTRCDLRDGNTSWVPSDSPCVVSQAPPPSRARFAGRRD